MKNYYAILEVPVGCAVAEVREAYRRLVQENLWNRDAFAQLKEAYEVLTTPARRAEYDRTTFGETFPADGVPSPAAALNGEGRSARTCPMGAASQCPVLGARVPLSERFCPECGVQLSAMPEGGFLPFAADAARRGARLEDPAGQAFALHPGPNIVGREGADILLPDKTVSRRHARIVLSEEGQGATVEDLGSTNGTRISGVVVAEGSLQPLRSGAIVQFGSVEMRLLLPEVEETDTVTASARARLVPARGGDAQTYFLVPGVTTFGRRAESTVVLSGDPYISGSHAQIIADGDLFRLSDLGSTNGTLVNGTALAPNQPYVLNEGDEVVIGSTVYRFERIAAHSENAPPENVPPENGIQATAADSQDSPTAPAEAAEPFPPS